jgi:hypothetical protein
MTKLGPCHVRSKTESPCLGRAEVEIRGIPFCGPCARRQEAYFAIGELTQEVLHSLWVSGEVYEPLRNTHRSGAQEEAA